MKKKVIHIVSSPATSGVTALIRSIALGLRSKGWEPILVHYGRHEGVAVDLSDLGISVYAIKVPPLISLLKTLWVVNGFKNIIHRTNPSLIHAHSFDADLIAARARAKEKYPIIISVHSFSYIQWLKKHAKNYERWRHSFAMLIPVCEALAREIKEFPSLSNLRMKLIFNTPDQRFHEQITEQERTHSREALGLKHEDIVIACVANFHRVKGQDVLAHAFRLLAHKNQNIKLLLAGSAGIDHEREAFQLHVKKILNNELQTGQAIIVDPCHDSRLILSASDIYVQPSYTEALSVALGEAMASGLPIIATSVGGNPEIVLDGKTGLLVPPGDEKIMANIIETLINSPALRQKLGENARSFASINLTPSSTLSLYDCAYKQVLQGQ